MSTQHVDWTPLIYYITSLFTFQLSDHVIPLPSPHLQNMFLFLLSSDGSTSYFTENNRNSQKGILHMVPPIHPATYKSLCSCTLPFLLLLFLLLLVQINTSICAQTTSLIGLLQNSNNYSFFPTRAVFTFPLNLSFQHKIVQLFLTS